ncbi:hypothetical protein K438DRAFT_1767216 [Mycena galopus ATCC 62051]|nr:hypothetical protein K438DRAFT_1767216 [Mycena galopus ATCC 62051]
MGGQQRWLVANPTGMGVSGPHRPCPHWRCPRVFVLVTGTTIRSRADERPVRICRDERRQQDTNELDACGGGGGDLQSFDQERKRRLGRGANGGRTSVGGEDTVGAGDRGSKTRRGILGGEKSHVAADRAVLNEVRHAWLRTAKTSGAVRDAEAGKLAGECIVGFG